MDFKNLNSRTKKRLLIFIGILEVILVYFVMHVVHVTDMQSNQQFGQFIGSEGKNGIELTVLGIQEAITKPFYFKGLNLLHCVLPLLIINVVGGMALIYRAMLVADRKSEIYKKLENSTFWFGQRTALYRAIKKFEDKVEVVDKKTGEKHMESVIKEMPEWDYYEYKYETPYSKEDEAAGLADPNILLGKHQDNDDYNRKREAGPWIKHSMFAHQTNHNLNTLIMGGSGTGKTFRWLEPNLAQLNSSFAITDPSGEIFENMGHMLMEDGYRIWVFSTKDPVHSNCYNPLDYIYREDGVTIDQTKVSTLVSTFIKNANDTCGNGHKGDPFWEKSSRAWLTFAIMYCAEFLEVEQRNFSTILKLAQAGRSDENSSSSATLLDSIIERAKKQNPEAKCFSSYETFNIAPAKTRNSILISIAVDLDPFSQEEVRNLTSTSYICKRNKQGLITEYIKDPKGNLIKDSHNLDLPTIGDQKTALFIITQTAADPYGFLISMLYSQLFGLLYSRAETVSSNTYHIYAKNDTVLRSTFKTEEEANSVIKLYAEAEIKTETTHGETHHYIYNKAAGRDFTIVDKAAFKKYGYLEEVYTEELGLQKIEQYKEAHVKKGKLRLPIHTRLLLDEFANVSEIPQFEQFLSTMRKYEISCTIILQTYAQLKKNYGDATRTLIGQCDTIIFLGSPDSEETCKWFSDTIGDTLLKIVDTSESSSATSSSISMSHKNEATKLISASALRKLDNELSIIIIRGENPIMCHKMSFAEHKNFAKSGIANPNLKLDAKFTAEHYTCLTKKTAMDDTEKSVEEASTSVMQGNRVDQPDKPIRTRRAKAKAVKNKEDMAEAMDVPNEQVEEAVKNTTSIDPADKNTSGSMEVTPAAVNDAMIFDATFDAPSEPEIIFPNNTEGDNTTDTAEPAPAPTCAENTGGDSMFGPNADTDWVFQ
ncbi:TraG protein (plasmid) [Butyrivibrio proteoclasticus B316]|uniref:TraG protein n=1 Tax=Butyrivibrio proteoclasticus (strain ATCC 51982 / DSM 14932 / B316) TaxID=515622 RepID=E0S476_BUTPB|nr:type IV secretory system conjugative DNA transfer family protein [Butyrivibrio proteoclasticus]ADL36208.1 TraG protein [Butyrivibrio proteoclasticus B316]